MQAETIAAIAACAGAGLTVVNVAYQAHQASRRERQTWHREVLPEAILQYDEATFELSRLVFFHADEWRALSDDEKTDRGHDLFGTAMRLFDRLELIASPGLIEAGRNVTSALEDGLQLMRHVDDPTYYSLETERALYWAYAEAHEEYLRLARKELGLKPQPVPPGLQRWREQHEAAPEIVRECSCPCHHDPVPTELTDHDDTDDLVETDG